MKQEAVLEAIGKLNTGTMRPVVHGKSTKLLVSADGKMSFRRSAGNVVDVDGAHVEQLLKSVGIGMGLAGSISPDTLGRVGTDLLEKKERYNLVLDGKSGKVVDIIKPHGTVIGPERLIQNVERAVCEPDYHRVYEVNPHILRLEIMALEEAPVVRGDLIRAGTVVMFSPYGVTAPVVESFAVRLACTNGATSQTVIKSFSGGNGEGDNIWQWFRHSMKEAVGSVKAIAEKYAALRAQAIPPDQRAAILEGMLRESKLSDEAAAVIRDRALQEPPTNQYELLNLLTWGTSHLRLPGREIARAQSGIGRLLDEPARIQAICVACHQPVGRGARHAHAAEPAAPALPARASA